MRVLWGLGEKDPWLPDFGTFFECRNFDTGDLRKPTRCVLKRLEGYVFPRIALVVTERIVKIPD
jgi:hypothetical protein